MHNTYVSPFIYSLYTALVQLESAPFLRWDDKGEAVIVVDPCSISKSFLEHYFKYDNVYMLIKELYKHGFIKQKGSLQLASECGKEAQVFKNRHFLRGRVDLLYKVEAKKDIREIADGFMGPKYYGPNKVMRHQEHFIKTLSSASKCFRLLCEQFAALKQEILRKNEIKRFKSPKAILFDEDICSRITMSSYLKKAGFITYLAESGNDVIFKCARKNFKLIVISIRMLNILAILKKLSSEKKQSNLILIYKSEEVRCDLEDFRRLGVDEFLPSPCTEEHFISTIRRFEISEGI